MDFFGALQAALPPYMQPTNIGDYNKVAWPFTFSVEFDFGTNPTWTSTTRSLQSFQVTQEAGFLLQRITRTSYSYGTAGELAPLDIMIVDRQSTRTFMSNPMALQAIARDRMGTVFPSPYLFMPSAFVDITLQNDWLPNSQTTVGNGKHVIQLFGTRVRVADMGKGLTSVFG